MPLLSSSTSFVATDDDVTQDVLGQLDRPLELARLLRRERVLEDAVLAVAVLADLVGEAPADRWRHLVDLATERADGLLEPVAHGSQALFVGGRLDEIHELVWAHAVVPPSFPGSAADVVGSRQWGRAALVRCEKAPRPKARAVLHSVAGSHERPQRWRSDRCCASSSPMGRSTASSAVCRCSPSATGPARCASSARIAITRSRASPVTR